MPLGLSNIRLGLSQRGVGVRPSALGEELVSNGTFDTDTTGWSADASSTLSSVGGQLQFAHTGTDWAATSFATVVGKTYQVSGDIVQLTAGGFTAIRKADDAFANTNVVDVGSGSVGTFVETFIATATTTYITLQCNNAGTGIFDNISVKEIVNFPAFIRSRAQEGRVDFIGLGDSNHGFGGHGWDHGMQKVLSDNFPMYSTGLISHYEGEGGGAGRGYLYTARFQTGYAFTGAPAALDDYLDPGSGVTQGHNYGYLASGTIGWGSSYVGLIEAGCPLGVENAIQFDVHYGTFTTGSGVFKPAVRLGESPFTDLQVNSAVNTNTGSAGISIESVSISADGSRTSPLDLRIAHSDQDVTGPYFGLWWRAHVPAQPTGFCYHSLIATGGHTLRDMAFDLEQMSDTTLTYYLTETRRLQGPQKTIVIAVNSGLNDRNETDTSLGPDTVADGDSAAAYVDNFKAIRTRVEAIFTNEGWPLTELFWLIYPSHPVTDDTELATYRAAIADYAPTVSQTWAVDLTDYTSQAAMSAAGYYHNGGSDEAHLTQSAYEALARFVLTDII